MKKTLATLLALVMLSVMSLTVLAADITVDGDVSEWTGWVTVSAKDNESTNGTVQNTSAGKVTASYDYAVKVVDDTLYLAYKQDIAPVANSEPAQTNCTYVRLWIDNDLTTTTRLGLIDFGFDGEKTVVVRNDCKKDDVAIDVTVAGKAGENSYSFEAAIKLADLGITDNSFRYAVTASSPVYAVGGAYYFSADDSSVTMNIPKDFLETNTTYTIRSTAAFKNVVPVDGSVFVNFFYGETWGDIFGLKADADKDTKEMTFTTGATIEDKFTCTIGAWNGAKGDITVYSLEVLKGEEVVWSENFNSIPAGLEAGELVTAYAALHSIKYETGSEPWVTTEGFTVYSDEPVVEPDTSVDEKNPSTGDPMMVFALIALLTIAGTVVAVKKVR